MMSKQSALPEHCPNQAAANGWAALARLMVLVGLAIWAFWPELHLDYLMARHYSESSFALASPVILALLWYQRRKRLAAEVNRGSVWGVTLILFGFLILAAGIWPYRYGYFRHIAVVPVVAGGVLASCGRRVWFRCWPMLLWVALCIPIPQRVYHELIVKPETYTLSMTQLLLDMIPDAAVELNGPNLSYLRRGGESGTIAAAEPHRGASLLLTYIGLGVFVAFVTVRPFWQVAFLAVAAVPIALACNLVRLLTWGIVTIYWQAAPTSAMPRVSAAIVSICLAYAMFACLGWLMNNLVTEEDEVDGGANVMSTSAAVE